MPGGRFLLNNGRALLGYNGPMVMPLRSCAFIVAGLLVLACGEPEAAPTQTEVPTPPTSTPLPTAHVSTPLPTVSPPLEPAVITIVEPPGLGGILVDAAGRTLYLSTDDERNVANCYEGRADAFPPVLAGGEPSAGEGVSASRVGAVSRRDGSNQVAYNGWPLYYFAADRRPGDAIGQGPGDSIGQNVGNVWFVVSPPGLAVTAPVPTPPSMEMEHTPTSVPTSAPLARPPRRGRA